MNRIGIESGAKDLEDQDIEIIWYSPSSHNFSHSPAPRAQPLPSTVTNHLLPVLRPANTSKKGVVHQNQPLSSNLPNLQSPGSVSTHARRKAHEKRHNLKGQVESAREGSYYSPGEAESYDSDSSDAVMLSPPPKRLSLQQSTKNALGAPKSESSPNRVNRHPPGAMGVSTPSTAGYGDDLEARFDADQFSDSNAEVRGHSPAPSGYPSNFHSVSKTLPTAPRSSQTTKNLETRRSAKKRGGPKKSGISRSQSALPQALMPRADVKSSSTNPETRKPPKKRRIPKKSGADSSDLDSESDVPMFDVSDSDDEEGEGGIRASRIDPWNLIPRSTPKKPQKSKKQPEGPTTCPPDDVLALANAAIAQVIQNNALETTEPLGEEETIAVPILNATRFWSKTSGTCIAFPPNAFAAAFPFAAGWSQLPLTKHETKDLPYILLPNGFIH